MRNLFLESSGTLNTDLLQTILAKDKGVGENTDAGVGESAALSLATIEIISQIRSLGASLRNEIATRIEATSGELSSRLELSEERLQQLEESGTAVMEDRLQKLESDSSSHRSMADQMVPRLKIQKLAELLASETAMWRSSKLQSDARFNYVEKVIEGLGDAASSQKDSSEPELPPDPELPPLMSDDLKDTLETLMSTLNRTLKPENPPTLRQQSQSFAGALACGGTASPDVCRNPSTSRGSSLAGPFPLRHPSPSDAHLNNLTDVSLASRQSSTQSPPMRPMSTDTGLRPYIRCSPTFISGSGGAARAVSLHGQHAATGSHSPAPLTARGGHSPPPSTKVRG